MSQIWANSSLPANVWLGAIYANTLQYPGHSHGHHGHHAKRGKWKKRWIKLEDAENVLSRVAIEARAAAAVEAALQPPAPIAAVVVAQPVGKAPVAAPQPVRDVVGEMRAAADAAAARAQVALNDAAALSSLIMAQEEEDLMLLLLA